MRFTSEQLLALHEETCAQTREIMRVKNHDYTTGSADPFANFRMAEMLGMSPVSGLLLRMLDKIKRIQTFAEKGNLLVKGESAEDACHDLVNYAILCKGLLREAAARQEAQKGWNTQSGVSAEQVCVLDGDQILPLAPDCALSPV